MDDETDCFFSGRKLYGDDFTGERLKRWFEEEQEGYADVISLSRQDYDYKYHSLNSFHLFSRVQIPPGARALGIGSAFGSEFDPIREMLQKICIVDPSSKFSKSPIVGTTYHKPTISGALEFDDESFEIATSFGALHHIANVTDVVHEVHRCLTVGGLFLVREPIVTQGDWRTPRQGLTKNERGIPYDLMLKIFETAGFEIEHKALFDFSPFTGFIKRFGIAVFNNEIATKIDSYLAILSSKNRRYHRTKLIHYFGPASIALVLRKSKFVR